MLLYMQHITFNNVDLKLSIYLHGVIIQWNFKTASTEVRPAENGTTPHRLGLGLVEAEDSLLWVVFRQEYHLVSSPLGRTTARDIYGM